MNLDTWESSKYNSQYKDQAMMSCRNNSKYKSIQLSEIWEYLVSQGLSLRKQP